MILYCFVLILQGFLTAHGRFITNPTELTSFELGFKKISIWESPRNSQAPQSSWKFRLDPLIIPVTDNTNEIEINVGEHGREYSVRFMLIFHHPEAVAQALSMIKTIHNINELDIDQVHTLHIKSLTISIPGLFDQEPDAKFSFVRRDCPENSACWNIDSKPFVFPVVIYCKTNDSAQNVKKMLKNAQIHYKYTTDGVMQTEDGNLVEMEPVTGILDWNLEKIGIPFSRIKNRTNLDRFEKFSKNVLEIVGNLTNSITSLSAQSGRMVLKHEPSYMEILPSVQVESPVELNETNPNPEEIYESFQKELNKLSRLLRHNLSRDNNTTFSTGESWDANSTCSSAWKNTADQLIEKIGTLSKLMKKANSSLDVSDVVQEKKLNQSSLRQEDWKCDADWVKFCTQEICNCYVHLSYDQKQSDAKGYCRAYGSNLASINSAEEQEFIRKLGSGWIWTGLELNPSSGYEWIDGSPLTYTNWKAGKPRNGRCVDFFTNSTTPAFWNDVSCERFRYVLCKKPAFQFVQFVDIVPEYD